MRSLVACFALLAVAAGSAASAQSPFPAGDAKQGGAMVAKDCNACHVRRFGNVDAAYTRIDRRVTTPAQLKAQIAFCNSQLGTGYFPDEEEHIAAYLDLQYYKFKP
ncbi:MAG: cytochrome c [Casimicrobiaceae bacterium]